MHHPDAALSPHDEALFTHVARWLELRMASMSPTLQQLLTELGRLAPETCAATEAEIAGHVVRAQWQRPTSPLRELCTRAGLDDRLDAMLLLALWVLADEPDLELMRRQAFNDDAFFTAQFVLRLLTDEPRHRARLMARLEPDAPLRALRLVHLTAPATRPHTALRHHIIELDEAVLAAIDGRASWPLCLHTCVERIDGDEPPIGCDFFADQLDRLDRIQLAVGRRPTPVFGVLCSATVETSVTLARVWTARDERALFVMRAALAPTAPVELDHLIGCLVREARLRDGIILVVPGRGEDDTDPRALQLTLAALSRLNATARRPVLIDAPRRGDERLRNLLPEVYEVRTLPPTLEQQVDIWCEALSRVGLEPLPRRELRQHVCDLALEVGDIQRAARLAANNAWLGRTADPTAPLQLDAAHLRATVASRLNRGMQGVAERITTTLRWSDLILPDTVVEGLMDVITYARYQRQVFEEWGFGAKMPYGRANSCLFGGPPGTGKTMAAGVIARELGMDLFRVDLSQVVSKWVGETEKNLGRVFDEAARGHAVLLFDEADSLFGKRTAVKSSNDRYNNLQVNYLLQRMESFEGITILTSNLADGLDDAFLRRLKFKVVFSVPDACDRARLWRVMLPRGATCCATIDFEHLGEAFEMAGGHIKNAVLRAAFRAAEAGTAIDTSLLEQAGISELREMGKLVRVDEDGRLVTPEPTTLPRARPPAPLAVHAR